MTVRIEKPASYDEIKAALKAASESPELKGCVGDHNAVLIVQHSRLH